MKNVNAWLELYPALLISLDKIFNALVICFSTVLIEIPSSFAISVFFLKLHLLKVKTSLHFGGKLLILFFMHFSRSIYRISTLLDGEMKFA